jgi:hypothetical protein
VKSLKTTRVQEFQTSVPTQAYATVTKKRSSLAIATLIEKEVTSGDILNLVEKRGKLRALPLNCIPNAERHFRYNSQDKVSKMPSTASYFGILQY